MNGTRSTATAIGVIATLLLVWMVNPWVDVPEGLSMRVLAIAIVAPEARFERAVETAAPIVDSLEVHAS